MGLWPNTYIISDLDREMPVAQHPDPNVKTPIPVFIVKEDSNVSGCPAWALARWHAAAC